jgi:hypothetical protein
VTSINSGRPLFSTINHPSVYKGLNYVVVTNYSRFIDAGLKYLMQGSSMYNVINAARAKEIMKAANSEVIKFKPK